MPYAGDHGFSIEGQLPASREDTEQEQRNRYWDRINALSVQIQVLAVAHAHMEGNEDVLHDILYYDEEARSSVRSLYANIYGVDPDDDAMSDMLGDLVDAIIARRPKNG